MSLFSCFDESEVFEEGDGSFELCFDPDVEEGLGVGLGEEFGDGGCEEEGPESAELVGW